MYGQAMRSNYIFQASIGLSRLHSNRPPITPAAMLRRPPPTTLLALAAPVASAAAALAVWLTLPEFAATPVLALISSTNPDIGCDLYKVAVDVAASVVVASVAWLSFSTPAVITNSNVPTAEPLYGSVLLPGKFASVPPAVSLHIALSGMITQSIVAVKSDSGLGSPMLRFQVEGPKTRVSAGKRPQSMEVAQASARVVAVGFAVTTEPTMFGKTEPSKMSPIHGTDIVAGMSCCAATRPMKETRMNFEAMVTGSIL